MSDVPPPPPGFTVSSNQPRRGRTAAPRETTPPPPPGFTLKAPDVVDGDTLRSGGRTFRVWGMDAPELAQSGWNRSGVAVPVGQQSRGRLSDLIGGQSVVSGAPQGTSYGRTVAPLTFGGTDVAERLLREGQAFASPGFLGDDPERRFDYMQAERLARQNGLGVHDYLVQPPEQFREAPGYVPTRQDLAQFFDTPTPNQGLSAATEKGYLDVSRTGTPDDIMAYAEANGFKLDRGAVESFVRARDAGANVDYVATYTPPMQILTDLGDGRLGAGVRGFSQGFAAGGLDELGAFADMLGGTEGRENIWNSDRRLADIWFNNQQQNSSILGYDESAYPYLTTGTNVAGGLTSGFVIPWGNGVRGARALGGVGAAYGGLGGFLGTDGGLAERATGGVIGAGVGAVANPLLAKGVEAVSPAIARVWNAITGRAAPAGAGVAGDVAEGYGEEQALDAALSAAQQGRLVDALNIPRGSPMSAYAPGEPVPSAYPGPLNGRERDWFDISSIPPPPRGFALNHPPANDLTGPAGSLDEVIGMSRRPASMGMDAEGMPSLSGEVRQRDYIDVSGPATARARRMDEPLTDAETQAALSRLSPRDMLPIPANEVGSAEELAGIDAGRIVPARAPNERGALTSRTVRNWQGQEVPKVGPTDLVGFLRLRGGLRDEGGELSHMGLSNAARRGLDFVGQEQRFGPLVNNADGSSLDDAALAAWEAGYFPELSARPSINEFLEALDDTYRGSANRRFLPEDGGELDEFYGRQASRHDLEQQQHAAGGPVYVDRSVPGDENAPFPPPEAYEDWPGSEALSHAGNINLDKLETPQDIKRALVQFNNHIGFDAATRGRVTQEETERLASELGMTADDLLSRRKGQALNAEEALAARQILAASGNYLVNLARRISRLEHPGDELEAEWSRALMRHAAIQEQVSGATAEAGRALQQFRMLADSSQVSREVLATIRDAGGGTKRIKEAADMILDAVEDGPGKFNTRVRKLADPRFADKVAEFYINMLLSGPQTHVVNAISNTMTAISQIPEHALAAGFGGARRLVARREVDRVFNGEVGARLFSMRQGTLEGLRFFARALRTGETSDAFSKIAGHDMRAIKGLKGEVVRMPGRLLNSADEFFKGISRRAEINGLAYRTARKEGLTGEAFTRRVAELSANPPEDIEHKALDFARYMTFQRPLTGVGQHAQRLVRDHPLLRPIITFVRTPANLLKFGIERSPLAPMLKEWRADFRAGGARRDLAMARATLGTGIAALFYEMALDGRITGAAPTDEAKNRFMRADGWQPYSVRIGDQWVSYSRLDPFAIQIGIAADLATKADGMSDRQLDNYGLLLVGSIMGQLADKTWLSGVSDLGNALTDPERYGPNYLRNLGASFVVPNALAQTARSMDPYQRERETFGEELRARVPGLSDNLLPQRDIWGRPVPRNQLGPDLISPFRATEAENDPVNAAMLSINARFGPPAKQYSLEGQRQDYTPEQYDRLQELAGRSAYSGIAALISDPAWQGMDNRARLKAARKVFEQARKDARAEVLGLGGEGGSAPSQSPTDGAPPPPPGFTAVGEAAGRNVFRELQEKIPGLTADDITSGFRDYAYNQRLKARGYHPADNSTHMDGDTLDLVAPHGRSLSWLRAQVERNFPEATDFLIHDGHLHVRFPGYFGAPVLGGARGAGVRNPNAGMPAPPPGFTVTAQ